ncbi:V-type proton ATPase subunit S1-like protein isoform X2 [Zonotrichia albicollis]|uniref:V-type proton ATPase subunit S1-like protein isoform X2 n=1 Tax=Zonotrichia albicollis TaxID=44394 RepID=UPI003D80BF82
MPRGWRCSSGPARSRRPGAVPPPEPALLCRAGSGSRPPHGPDRCPAAPAAPAGPGQHRARPLRGAKLPREQQGPPWSHPGLPHSPLNVTINGTPCILFWARRILIRMENHTQLDLTDRTFGAHATVDVGDSNCSEDSAMLSLKFGDIGNLKGLVIRLLLTTSYYQLSVQRWFSLQRLQLLYNHSVQATFNASGIRAPAAHSFRCQHVSSLQRHDALLVPGSEHDLSHLWEVTFIDFQIQGFSIQEGHFAYARDCASFFSPAILMGLVMSLILLLVLAYALHMLIHLKSLDRHYECKAPPAYFAQMKDSDMGDEKEPLRNSGNESYELRNQQFGKIYI